MSGDVRRIWLCLLACGCGYDDGRLDAGLGPGGPGMRPDATTIRRDAATAMAACGNGLDDDCDGLVDFAGGDPGCASAVDSDERGAGNACDDGLDNDADGVTDYAVQGCTLTGDPGCTSPTDTSELNTPTPP